jgi:transcriptional regulator with XRE-family HTH domain
MERGLYVNGFSRIGEKLREKAYRDGFVASQLKRGLPTQIRVMLKDRGWSQSDLAERSGLKQGVISRAADPDYGNLTINTILKIASGFDVAYVGRFVPFSDLAKWYANLSEPALSVSEFAQDRGFTESTSPAKKARSKTDAIAYTQGTLRIAQATPIVATGLGMASVTAAYKPSEPREIDPKDVRDLIRSSLLAIEQARQPLAPVSAAMKSGRLPINQSTERRAA